MNAVATVACPECAGSGCPRCCWQGRQRAHLLLTVANRDTGAVASRRVLPTDLDPRPDGAGGWVADLTPRDLVATVAAAIDPEPLLVCLPLGWRPDLPAADRHALAAAALAESARRPWRLWLGGSRAPAPVDPDARLVQLCHLADLLRLDLVIEARRQGGRSSWTVRYHLPGVPVATAPVDGSPDLPTALARTDASAALAGLTDRGLSRRAAADSGPDRRAVADRGPAGDGQRVQVTLTDLRHRVVHLTWQAGTPESTHEVATAPDGRAVVRLPARYRLGAWARVFGVRPEDLAEADGGHEIPRDLRDGYVTLPWPGADPVGEYVRRVGRGLPAGRLFVTAVRPDVPPLPDLIRLVTSLGLALHVSLLDLRCHAGHPLRADGRYWAVEARRHDSQVRPDDLPTRPSLATALDECLTHLADDLAGLVPTDPTEPLPVPCSPAREPVADPEPALSRLAAAHPGQVVTLRFTPVGHTAHLHDGDRVRRLDLRASGCRGPLLVEKR